MTEYVGLRQKGYSDLTDDDSKGKKAKATKRCVITRRLIKRLLNNETILKS